jgi:hypothetical protein
MPLYRVTDEGLQAQAVAEFAALGLYERTDLQRLLRDDISPLGEDLLVIAEEFGQWQDARRRIDLLALEKAGRLVVIELKRTDDGGHMDLQAIRYAAMVSSMDFDQVLRTYAAHCAKHRAGDELDARSELLGFLDRDDDGDDPAISTNVRIILVSADFSREITTTVLWLNSFEGMDIRCVRLVPYELDGEVLLDIQQVLPLPEAADYQVQIRRKDAARERARADGRDFTRYHVIVDGVELPDENKLNTVRVMIEQLAKRRVPLADIRAALPRRALKVVPGRLTDPDEVRRAIRMVDPGADVGRFFCDEPFIDKEADQTYVLFKMWGRNTEPALSALTATFPQANISFRRADNTQ